MHYRPHEQLRVNVPYSKLQAFDTRIVDASGASTTRGWGVRCAAPISEGQVVVEVRGRALSEIEYEGLEDKAYVVSFDDKLLQLKREVRHSLATLTSLTTLATLTTRTTRTTRTTLTMFRASPSPSPNPNTLTTLTLTQAGDDVLYLDLKQQGNMMRLINDSQENPNPNPSPSPNPNTLTLTPIQALVAQLQQRASQAAAAAAKAARSKVGGAELAALQQAQAMAESVAGELAVAPLP